MSLLKTTLIGLFFGTFGTMLGGFIGVGLKNISNRFISFILSLASGLMISIVCFDLIPEALELSKFINIVVGIFFGVFCMIACDSFVNKKFKVNSLLKTGVIVSIGLALHNFPEGLAIGSGFVASLGLGYSLAFAIAFHDIPEGISMAIPMKNGGMKTWKVIFYVILSGVTTGLGALVGGIIGTISNEVIALCLSFAAGAMMYIVAGELIPESRRIHTGRINAIGNIIGIVLGLVSLNF